MVEPVLSHLPFVRGRVTVCLNRVGGASCGDGFLMRCGLGTGLGRRVGLCLLERMGVNVPVVALAAGALLRWVEAALVPDVGALVAVESVPCCGSWCEWSHVFVFSMG